MNKYLKDYKGVGLLEVITGTLLIGVVTFYDLARYGWANLVNLKLYLIGFKGVILIWIGWAIIVYGIVKIVRFLK